jgi:hypothetical protein
VRILLPLLLLASCGSPSAAYVDADRATYAAIAPEYLRYVDADPTLDADSKAVRRLSVATWDKRIRDAESVR